MPCKILDKSGEILLNLPELDTLRGADLSEKELIGANLVKADLLDIFLHGAKLIDADFSGAILVGAELCGTDLTRARFRGAEMGLVYEGTKEKRCFLQGACLYKADFSKANLAGALFSSPSSSKYDYVTCEMGYGYLREANFEGAILRGAHLYKSDLYKVNFIKADLRGAIFDGSNLEGARFYGADVIGAYGLPNWAIQQASEPVPDEDVAMEDGMSDTPSACYNDPDVILGRRSVLDFIIALRNTGFSHREIAEFSSLRLTRNSISSRWGNYQRKLQGIDDDTL